MVNKTQGFRSHLSSDKAALCDQWFSCVETSDCWLATGKEHEASESRAFDVRRESDGLLGTAKRAVASDGNCRAAHEKLAFDLAHLLDLPVPPVVLWNRDPEAIGNELFAISAHVFAKSLEWPEACKDSRLSESKKMSVSRVMSAMIVFHVWINDGNQDNPDHILVDKGSLDERLAIAFIDHAGSMQGAYWGETLASDCFMPLPRDWDAMMATADEIGQLAESEIRDLVARIPCGYLPKPEDQQILTNLLKRKARLRTLIESAARQWSWWGAS